MNEGITPPPRKLRVFLCHSSRDKSTAHALYHRLSADGIDPWLDVEKLLPGQDWELEIRKAVKSSDVIIVCLSESSISKRGFVQKELRYALDVAEEQPEGAIFLIPLKLEECEVPDRLRTKQWVDYFQPNGYELLAKALAMRAREIGIEARRVSGSDKTQDSTRVRGWPPETEGPNSRGNTEYVSRDPQGRSQESDGDGPSGQPLAYSKDGSFHRQGAAPKNRAGRWAVHFLSRPAAVIALLVSGLLLILSISFASQWMRWGREPQSAPDGHDLVRPNQPSEPTPFSQPAESPSSSGPSKSVRRGLPSEINFALYPNLVRGDGERSTIRTSSGVKVLRLHLLLLADKYQSYRGELFTEDGRILVESPDLRASVRDAGEAVIMELSDQGLPAGDYRVKLSGRTDDGQTLEIASYYFRITHW